MRLSENPTDKKFFPRLVGFSDGGISLVIVNARFQKWDKNLLRFHRKIR